MDRTLVICLCCSVAAGLVAAMAASLAGWGWLASFAVYSGAGSISLMSSVLIAWARPAPAATVAKPHRAAAERRAYA